MEPVALHKPLLDPSSGFVLDQAPRLPGIDKGPKMDCTRFDLRTFIFPDSRFTSTWVDWDGSRVRPLCLSPPSRVRNYGGPCPSANARGSVSFMLCTSDSRRATIPLSLLVAYRVRTLQTHA